MIKTLSLCPTCYQKIEAEIHFQNGMVVMTKECPDHGPFSAIVEKDIQHVSNFYHLGTLGRNNTIIIHTHNQCNMKCAWCYYPMGVEPMHPFTYYNNILAQYGGYNLLMSGGEPTLRPDFFEFTQEAAGYGWGISAITNMLKLAEPEFFTQALNSPLHQGNMLKFALSMQHPKNYSSEILAAKVKALENFEATGKHAMCAMFSIQSLDELDYIREWFDVTKKYYPMLRIRTMFKNWANKGDDTRLFLSDLHKAFLHKFADLHPRQSLKVEQSNMYCLYLEVDGGTQISLSGAPTVENLDYHQASRPVFMLAMDGRCYPVPICQIINEGIALGWKDGFRLQQGGAPCG
jgi:hypothetical protein